MPGATIAPTGTFFDLKIEEFQRVLELNLTGTVLPTQVFLKPMVEQKAGAIVNFSSMAAFRPMTRVAGYAAAKAGISNFTAFMATEVAKKFGEGIRVNAIAPGFFLTEQNRALLTNPDGSYTERGQDVIRQTPFGRMGRAEELCRLRRQPHPDPDDQRGRLHQDGGRLRHRRYRHRLRLY